MVLPNKLINKYLIVYNSIQTIGWYYIIISMVWRYVNQGSESIESTFTSLGNAVVTLQILAFLEIVHIVLGFVRSSLLPTLAQVFGRNHVLLAALWYVPQVQNHWGVALMFLIWGLSELIRYPFYLCSLIGNTPKWLTWLRYNAFIILYPIGFGSENILWYYMLPFIKKNRIHYIDMPNSLNFGFNYYYFLLIWISITLLMFPQLYMHMFKLRAKKNNLDNMLNNNSNSVKNK